MWTNTNTLGNTRKERTQGRHRMAMRTSDTPWGGVNCIHMLFYFVSYHWVWSQTWHEWLTKLCSQLQDETFSLMSNFLFEQNLRTNFFCWSVEQHLSVFCERTAQKLDRWPWGCALKRQFSNTHWVIYQVAFPQAYQWEDAAWALSFL